MGYIKSIKILTMYVSIALLWGILGIQALTAAPIDELPEGTIVAIRSLSQNPQVNNKYLKIFQEKFLRAYGTDKNDIGCQFKVLRHPNNKELIGFQQLSGQQNNLMCGAGSQPGVFSALFIHKQFSNEFSDQYNQFTLEGNSLDRVQIKSRSGLGYLGALIPNSASIQYEERAFFSRDYGVSNNYWKDNDFTQFAIEIISRPKNESDPSPLLEKLPEGTIVTIKSLSGEGETNNKYLKLLQGKYLKAYGTDKNDPECHFKVIRHKNWIGFQQLTGPQNNLQTPPPGQGEAYLARFENRNFHDDGHTWEHFTLEGSNLNEVWLKNQVSNGYLSARNSSEWWSQGGKVWSRDHTGGPAGRGPLERFAIEIVTPQKSSDLLSQLPEGTIVSIKSLSGEGETNNKYLKLLQGKYLKAYGTDKNDPECHFKVIRHKNWIGFQQLTGPQNNLQTPPPGQGEAYLARFENRNFHDDGHTWEHFTLEGSNLNEVWLKNQVSNGYLSARNSSEWWSQGGKVWSRDHTGGPAGKGPLERFAIEIVNSKEQATSANELSLPAKDSIYDSWKEAWKFSEQGRGAIIFDAKANNDIHIALSSKTQTLNPMYEIVFGGWNNTRSVVRRQRRGPDMAESAGRIATPNQFATYWLIADKISKTICLGNGDKIGENILLSFYDPNFLTDIQYFAFSSYNTPIEYKNIKSVALDNSISQALLSQLSIPAKRGTYDNWKESWKLPEQGLGAIIFEVKAQNDIHIGFSSKAQTLDPMYEIIFGGWANTKSAVRKKSQGPNVMESTMHINTPNQFGTFWVMVDKQTKKISLGEGNEVGKNILIEYYDPAFLANIEYFCFTSWDVPIEYKNIKIVPAKSLPSTPAAILSPAQLGHYSSWHEQNKLPEPGNGIVTFKAKAANDIHVGFSSHLQLQDPMYEIVLGGWNNTKSAIRRKSLGPDLKLTNAKINKPNEFADYWIIIDKHTKQLSMGEGTTPGENTLIEFTDQTFLDTVQYLAFTSWTTPIEYTNIAIQELSIDFYFTTLFANASKIKEYEPLLSTVQTIINQALEPKYKGKPFKPTTVTQFANIAQTLIALSPQQDITKLKGLHALLANQLQQTSLMSNTITPLISTVANQIKTLEFIERIRGIPNNNNGFDQKINQFRNALTGYLGAN